MPSTRGVFVGPRTRMLLQKLKQRSNDETGAELVEFAFVIVLLITILYGIITYGMILAAQSTLTQAAADAARAGLTVGLQNAAVAAQGQAQSDVSWMDKGTCGTLPTSNTIIKCLAATEPCPSNTSMNASTECLKVTLIYDYSDSPLFPELPGLGLITPSTITSTNIIQLGTVS
jgi:Flp pilus assembly protein TadG